MGPWGDRLKTYRTDGGVPTRENCFVAHPDQPPGPFALTPALSRSDVGSVDRWSVGGRGGTRAAVPRVSRRSDSPTDARSVGSGVVESEKGEQAILLGDFWPILILRLPFGSFVCGHGPSRADTEVRPPATL